MALQIWRTVEIENVLWGTQTVASAIVAASKKSDQTDYQPGFQQGFLTTSQQVRLAFNKQLQSDRIEFQQDVIDTLLAVQSVIVSGETNQSGSQSPEYGYGFNCGQETALMCLATFFGVSLLSPANNLSLSHNTPWPSLWFREDIGHILTAFQIVTVATINATKTSAQLLDYQTGFEDALRVIARSLRIHLLSPSSVNMNSETSRLRKDIEHTLLTIYHTKKSTASSANGRQSIDDQLGFETALNSLAMAFGVTLK